MIHSEPHPLAGKAVVLKDGVKDPLQDAVSEGAEYRVEDWWDRVAGKSWTTSDGNPAAMQYAMRKAFNGLPVDDEVVYGKIGSFGHIVHVTELGDPS